MSAGTDMMLNTVFKALKIDPEEIKQTIANIGQIMTNANAYLAAIHSQNARIEAKLDLVLKAQGLEYVAPEISVNGSADRIKP